MLQGTLDGISLSSISCPDTAIDTNSATDTHSEALSNQHVFVQGVM